MSPDTDRIVGVDVGYKDCAILSDGTRLNGPAADIAIRLAKEHAVVCTETIDGHPKLMHLIKRIGQACKAFGKRHVQVGQYYPSSKTCFECKAINHGLSARERVWTCHACGVEHDRDVNAARNIRAMGIKMLQSKLC